jgi:hypothetical protein
MRLRYFLIAAITIIVISCKKDGGNGLTVKIESVSSNVVPLNGSLRVVLNFTDAGGHPIDTVYIKKIRINQDSALVPPSNSQPDVFQISAPSYNGNAKGQLQLDLDYTGFLKYATDPPQIGTPPQDENDSLIIKFAIKDNANNKSDTVSTGLIIIQRVN